MFVDKVRILIKAGNGGNGAKSFHREKYVTQGGPDGGDGGRGGSIIFTIDKGANTLINYYYQKHFKAENGANGQAKNCTGKNGKDVVLKVPRGTLIKCAETDNIIADMFYEDAKEVILKGGRGGKGNAFFKSSTRQSPNFAQLGEETDEKWVVLELKTIADVALVGKPNAGKSSLLSVISNAKPKIADYHFTTLSPNLGVTKYHDFAFVVADIPGLIEGASEGHGLGHEFLRHIERTRLLIHVVDFAATEGRCPFDDYLTIVNEKTLYNKMLSTLPCIIALNKIDLFYDNDSDSGDTSKSSSANKAKEKALKDFTSKLKKHTTKAKKQMPQIIEISTATKHGIDTLIKETATLLKTLPPPKPIDFTPIVLDAKKPLEYEITKDTLLEREDDGVVEREIFVVSGTLIDLLARNVAFDDFQSVNYFYRKLNEFGVIEKLKAEGMVEGSIVKFGDLEFDWTEDE
ncbi:MAG: GTPase ObgE [Firmicutes bacterium]|nr:GTPase ObgE [Bacillota bacterium]